MKKLLATLLATAMMVTMLAACSSSSSSDADFTTANEGVLTMGTNAAFPPYEYYEGDQIVGIDAEIATARRWGWCFSTSTSSPT